jgi:hypothetical protein
VASVFPVQILMPATSRLLALIRSLEPGLAERRLCLPVWQLGDLQHLGPMTSFIWIGNMVLWPGICNDMTIAVDLGSNTEHLPRSMLSPASTAPTHVGV